MVKISEINRTSTFAWSSDPLPLLATGTVAGAVDANFNSSSTLEIWDIFDGSKEPIVSSSVDARFHALSWSKPFDTYSKGLLAGGLENGTLQLWNPELLIKDGSDSASVFSSNKHTGPVKSLQFNPIQNHLLATGGSKGEIFIWDTKKLSEPLLPGQAMSPMDDILSLSWNNSVSHIFASAGTAGYTSIWDLKAKREVLHLSYSGPTGRANLSVVSWHPTQSTKLVTASDNDGTPLILTWDLRNANAPEKIMEGHKKGVLSLDWCKQDEDLLLSSGKDNATYLWNPITGQKLGEYPTTANWAYNTKFAPSAPDVFATASFDGKIIVQSLQDTSPPVSSRVKSTSEDDFWNQISNTDTQQPEFAIKQAPIWLKRPTSVSFGFGNKLVSLSKTDSTSTISINKFIANNNLQESSENLSEALKTNDFTKIIDSRLDSSINDVNKFDWEVLKQLSKGNKIDLLKEQIKLAVPEKPETVAEEIEVPDVKDVDADDSFFANLGAKVAQAPSSYVPEGSFNIFEATSDVEKSLINSVILGKVPSAIDVCLENDKLVEALILALDSSDSDLKQKVKNYYFKNNTSSISRILYSTSSANVTDIVNNADVANWKEIAASIASYCTDADEFNTKITELGDRILASESKPSEETRKNSIICYLAGGSLDKVAAIWLSELSATEVELLESADNKISSPSDAHFEALNIFVEKVSAYRAATKLVGEFSGAGIESTCNAFLEYSNLVAGFGQFDLADKFLTFLPASIAGLNLEKDRLTKASGVKPEPVQQQQPVQTATKGKYGRLPQQAVPSSNPYFAAAAPVPAFPGVPVSSYQPPIPNYANGASVQPPIGNFSSPLAQQAKLSNPYKPLAPQNPISEQSPIASPKPPMKQDKGGWNDLPNTFKPMASARRAAPAAVASPYAPPAQMQQVPAVGPTPTAPSRHPSFNQPPIQPPPPRTISASAKKPVVTSPPPPPATSRYAPPPQAAAPPLTSPAPSHIQTMPQSSIPPPPPKNPYAPGASASTTPVTSSSSMNAPPKNPYAPPPQASQPAMGAYGVSAPPPPHGSAGIAPPPMNPYSQPQSMNNYASPQMPNSGILPPPPVGAPVPGQQFQAPPPPPIVQQQIEPEEPAKPTYPPGDREHIPVSARPVYEILSQTLSSLRPIIPQQYTKHLDDAEKRINILFDHLNNEELLTPPTIAGLVELCNALKSGDYQTAQGLHVQIATNHSDETGNWMTGVKRIIGMAEAIQT